VANAGEDVASVAGLLLTTEVMVVTKHPEATPGPSFVASVLSGNFTHRAGLRTGPLLYPQPDQAFAHSGMDLAYETTKVSVF
jgi:hypothetical protein